MRCPRCSSDSTKGTWRTRVRRGSKEMRVHVECWRCSNCRVATGPFQFVTVDLDMQNDETIAAAWQEKFSEPIPPALPGVRMRKFMRTDEGKQRMAEAFGKVIAQKIKERSS